MGWFLVGWTPTIASRFQAIMGAPRETSAGAGAVEKAANTASPPGAPPPWYRTDGQTYMDLILKAIPLLVVLGALFYLVGRTIGRQWVEYRVRMALLKKLEKRPELLGSFDELQGLLDGSSADSTPDERQDLTVTGMFLAAIGAAGIPSAGLVTMAIVLKAVGLPLEGIGMILAVDRILDMCRTSVNVWGDTVGCAVVSRLQGEEVPEQLK